MSPFGLEAWPCSTLADLSLSERGLPMSQSYVPVSKERWIEMYGGQELLDREGFTVVPCVKCDDAICHGWRVVRTAQSAVIR